ncbi:DUF2798 domain-containing protein [Idiomarina loihiensis]|nr:MULTISPECIES: DUF2798 domain-containing protein [Idiomarina]
MSFLMSFWITWVNLGFTHSFIHDWLTAFLLAWPAAFVTTFLLMKPVEVLTSKILTKEF